MNRSHRIAMGVLLAGVACLAQGCGGGDLDGPPELRLGRDQCAECGMLVSEARSAGALLIERGGVREHLVFDDIGCLLDHRHGHPSDWRELHVYVCDRSTQAWIDAGTAVFLLADRDVVQTPMGSGIAAFAAADVAEAARTDFGGKIMSFDELGPARRAWIEARFGVSDVNERLAKP